MPRFGVFCNLVMHATCLKSLLNGGVRQAFAPAQVYIAPYLMVNMWLVMITLLQHTHPSLPHYTDAEWEWLRGALSTVDRSYGLLDMAFHHIADTHVCHHLFSTMPHYHAQVGLSSPHQSMPSSGEPCACSVGRGFSVGLQTHRTRDAVWCKTGSAMFLSIRSSVLQSAILQESPCHCVRLAQG